MSSNQIFKDLEFETAERLEKKMKNILSKQQKLFYTMKCSSQLDLSK